MTSSHLHLTVIFPKDKKHSSELLALAAQERAYLAPAYVVPPFIAREIIMHVDADFQILEELQSYSEIEFGIAINDTATPQQVLSYVQTLKSRLEDETIVLDAAYYQSGAPYHLWVDMLNPSFMELYTLGIADADSISTYINRHADNADSHGPDLGTYLGFSKGEYQQYQEDPTRLSSLREARSRSVHGNAQS